MSESLLSSLDSLSETIFGSAQCTVMHSDAIVFLSNNTNADWPNFCKRQTGSHNFTPKMFCYVMSDWSIASS